MRQPAHDWVSDNKHGAGVPWKIKSYKIDVTSQNANPKFEACSIDGRET